MPKNSLKIKTLIKIFLSILLLNSSSIFCKSKEEDLDTEEENQQEFLLPKNFEEDEYKLVEINIENFEEKIQKVEHFLLLIHNPWCKYSQKMSQKLLSVHKILKLETQEFYIGALDSSIVDTEKFIEKFFPENFIVNNFYPKVIYFHKSQAIEIYNDKPNRDSLLTFIKRKIYSESINLKIMSSFDFKVTHDKNAFIFVDTLTQKNKVTQKEKLSSKEGFELFNQLAKKFTNVMFYHTNDNKIADELFEKNEIFRNNTIHKRDFNVLYFTKGKLQDVYLNKKLTIMFDKSFNHFISKQIRSNFYTKFSEDAINEIFIKKQPAFFLFRNPFFNSTQHLEENLPLLASQDPNIKFVLTDTVGKYELKLMNLLLVDPNKLPQIRIIDFNNGLRRFENLIGNEIEDVIDFIKEYKTGKIKPYYSSNSNNNLQENKKSQLKDIGNGQFYEKVLNSKRNSLVFYYTKWCGHCKKIFPVLEILQKKLNGELFELFIYDVEGNDNNDLNKVPVLKLYKSMKKDLPITLNFEITFKEIMKFLQRETNIAAIKKDL